MKKEKTLEDALSKNDRAAFIYKNDLKGLIGFLTEYIMNMKKKWRKLTTQQRVAIAEKIFNEYCLSLKEAEAETDTRTTVETKKTLTLKDTLGGGSMQIESLNIADHMYFENIGYDEQNIFVAVQKADLPRIIKFLTEVSNEYKERKLTE